MTENQKRENDAYFRRVIETLREGGTYGFVNIQEVLVKKGDKLACSEKALTEIKAITTKDFFEKHFIGLEK